MKDNINIAINHLLKALQYANDDFEKLKDNTIEELNDFSDWDCIIKILESLINICKINKAIHKNIEDLDELLRKE